MFNRHSLLQVAINWLTGIDAKNCISQAQPQLMKDTLAIPIATLFGLQADNYAHFRQQAAQLKAKLAQSMQPKYSAAPPLPTLAAEQEPFGVARMIASIIVGLMMLWLQQNHPILSESFNFC